MSDDMDIKDNDGRKTKGRGFKDSSNIKGDLEERYVGKGAAFDNDDSQTGPVKCNLFFNSSFLNFQFNLLMRFF